MKRLLALSIVLVPSISFAGPYMTGIGLGGGSMKFDFSPVFALGPRAAVLATLDESAGAAAEAGLYLGVVPIRHDGETQRTYELELTVGRALDTSRWQMRAAVGTSYGHVGWMCALGGEFISDDPGTFLGPELRVRFRDDGRDPFTQASVFLRADLFIEDRAEHADRISLGISGSLDLF